MLYEIAFIVMAFSLPFFCFLSFRWGYRFGNNGEQAEKVEIIPKLKKRYKPSPEIERFNKELMNVENYVGDSTGQVKI